MNTFSSLFGVLLCLVMVNGRNFGEQNLVEGQSIDSIPHEDNLRRARDHGAGDMRHRKRRWQNYGYDYTPPTNPFFETRMDGYNRNQDLLPLILRQLDEISAQLKYQRQPIAPQPIYVPYPVPYPVPQFCSCSNAVPNITDRFNMDDQNQNWGLEIKPTNFDDEGDGSRPISFTPIAALKPMSRPPPKVEHGSTQAGEPSTQAPVFAAAPQQSSGAGRIPGMCNAAILSCCGLNSNQQQMRCFANFTCNATFARGNACNKESVANALESFKAAYSPA